MILVMSETKTGAIRTRSNKHQRVCKLLLENHPSSVWKWLPKGKRLYKKSANKFILGSILDFGMRADLVWENARRFAEDELGDPKDLWETIISIPRWNSDTMCGRYHLHRFRAGHKRVRRIGKEIVEHYSGDTRKIWKNQRPDKILERLERMRVGPQISRMIVGALYDTKQISEAGDLKADIHVRRVLGRVFTGKVVSPVEAHRIANKMISGKSWMLDAPLYALGKSKCKKRNPACVDCYLRKKCKYYKTT